MWAAANPYASPLNEAVNFLVEANTTLAALEAQSGQSFVRSVLAMAHTHYWLIVLCCAVNGQDTLQQELDGLRLDVLDLSASLNCTEPNHIYNSALHDICTTATLVLCPLLSPLHHPHREMLTHSSLFV